MVFPDDPCWLLGLEGEWIFFCLLHEGYFPTLYFYKTPKKGKAKLNAVLKKLRELCNWIKTVLELLLLVALKMVQLTGEHCETAQYWVHTFKTLFQWSQGQLCWHSLYMPILGKMFNIKTDKTRLFLFN